MLASPGICVCRIKGEKEWPHGEADTEWEGLIFQQALQEDTTKEADFNRDIDVHS